MQNSPSFNAAQELTAESSKVLNQCFVCDQVFRSANQLQLHQRGNHCEVVIFEVLREKRQIRSFTNLWRIGNFDDLLGSAKVSTKKIRKKKKPDVAFDTDTRTRLIEVPGQDKCDN